MAEICQDIDQGLVALNRKIDEQNRRLRDLEQKQKQCCDENNKNNNNNNNNDLERRVKKLEDDVLDLGGIIKDCVDDLADLMNTALEHTKVANSAQSIFSAIIDFFVDE
ncbi:hypothetical protein [Nostoc sp. NMS8]|uniref:hypothetical protein n=1 Tax=Nostoc sp. NMS8 TaxID=2815392 RepID=UPI0025D10F1F|nr:hypothetical protein [Nostoc sp. NMS8]MBN3959256.1 hypothetical protein [Nostoc sp. NMS8]